MFAKSELRYLEDPKGSLGGLESVNKLVRKGFYQEQPGSLGIVEILITGGATACGGLPEELERLLGIPVRVADPLARVKVARSLHDEESGDVGSMAVAVGLGIED